MITRREYLKLSLAAGVSLALNSQLAWADSRPKNLIRRAIPSRT